MRKERRDMKYQKCTHKVAEQYAVHELYHPDYHQKGHEGVHQLRPLRRLVDIFSVD